MLKILVLSGWTVLASDKPKCSCSLTVATARARALGLLPRSRSGSTGIDRGPHRMLAGNQKGPTTLSISDLMYQAFQASTAGRLEQAESLYLKVLEADDDQVDAWVALANLAA